MGKRFVSIWFPHLSTDWFTIFQHSLKDKALVLRTSSHGRMIVTAVSELAQREGIYPGMSIADARAIMPGLEVINDKPGLANKLLHRLAEWCIRFTPFAAIDAPGGLLLDASGCAHLWGGEKQYLQEIIKRLKARGYIARAAMADTIGCAWAVARYVKEPSVVASGDQVRVLMKLPPSALRLEEESIDRLHKLGLTEIGLFMGMQRKALLRRFGPHFIERLNQALGTQEEIITPVQPAEAYQERLPCPEPIATAIGIEIALKRLLDALCGRLQKEEKGARNLIFKGYRADGKTEAVEIGTNRASNNTAHLFKLFEFKLAGIEPDLGIELFVLEAKKTERIAPVRTTLWQTSCGLQDRELAELVDRLDSKFGTGKVFRYVPDEHHWPERSVKIASLHERPLATWNTNKPRPIQLLTTPLPIEVTAPIPDYPPMLFRYKGKLHKIKKADGPERIEQEWWLQQGQHRDYYYVEDEEGNRYWLFRLGHYDAGSRYQWFIHGFFA